MKRPLDEKTENQGDLFAAPIAAAAPQRAPEGLSAAQSLALVREKLDRLSKALDAAERDASGGRSPGRPAAALLNPLHLALDQALEQLAGRSAPANAPPAAPGGSRGPSRPAPAGAKAPGILLSKTSLAPTDEQLAILEDRGPRIIVHAFAGTGKTTTLQGYTERHPKLQFLYLVFNKPAQTEAKKRFGKNVRVVTSHGLAFQHTGLRYQHKLGNITAIDLREEFGCDYEFARDAIELLERYLASPDASLDDLITRAKCDEEVGQLAVLTWKAACDPENRAIKMPHDGYLKLYDLAGAPGLSKYHVVLLDEAQDANPLLLSILGKLPQTTRLIAVGDHYQSIYTFRGATNAMKAPLFKGATSHALTASWRFGEAVASAANSVLSEFGEKKRVRGMGGPSTLHAGGGYPEGFYAYLARTNANALEHAMSAARQDLRLHFCGGLERYRIDRLLDAHRLYTGYTEGIVDREFRKFSQFRELQDYAERIEDVEIQAICATVEKQGAELPENIARVRASTVQNEEDADRVISTAHKAKALEWDQVVLGPFFEWSDYEADKLLNRGVSLKYAEDLRLLYVAATRAKKELYSNATLQQAMRRHSDAAPITG